MKIKFGVRELARVKFARAVAAEFLGTVLLVLCIMLLAVSANAVQIGLGVGFAVATLASTFGHISGGHLNPAVTMGMVVSGRMAVLPGLVYITVQMIAGIIGAAIAYSCLSETLKKKLPVTAVHPDLTASQGFGLELLFTFLLVFYIFTATDPSKNTEPFNVALGIGVTVTVAHLCLVPFTGCSINPARSFGPAVVVNKWDDHWVYWVGPLVGGGILAPLLYHFIFRVKDNNKINNSNSNSNNNKVNNKNNNKNNNNNIQLEKNKEGILEDVELPEVEEL